MAEPVVQHHERERGVALRYPGEGDLASRAVVRSDITVNEARELNMKRVTAEGKGYTISGQNVADLDDYAKLILNVQELANDVAYLRSVVNTMIVQLKG